MHLGNWNQWKAWFREGLLGYIGFSALALAVGFALSTGNEKYMRLTGMYLQIAGTATVVFSLRQTLKYFGMPGIWRSFIAYLGRIPFRRRDAIAAGSTIELNPCSASGYGYGHIVPADQSMAAMHAAFQQLQTNVQNSLGALHETQKRLELDIPRQLNEVRAELSGQISGVRGDLVVTATGSGGLIVLGTAYIVAGTVLATATTELLGMFGL